MFDQEENPLQIANDIAQEMRTNQNEESSKLDVIRDGLQALQDRNIRLEELTKQRTHELEAAYEKAAQAQRVADDARRTAENSNNVTMEAMRQLLSIQEQNAGQPNDTTLSIPDLPPPDSTANRVGGAPDPLPPKSPDNPMEDISMARGIAATSQPPPPTPTVTPSFRSVPVFEQAINREKFADNLFGAGEYETAVAIYADLLKSPPEGSDVFWFQYQLACCYRNLGKFDQAERLYRMVAAEKESFLASTARWWLSMIEDQRMVNQTIGNLHTALSGSSADGK